MLLLPPLPPPLLLLLGVPLQTRAFPGEQPGEEEFLFTPYSVFTVLSLQVPDRPSVQDPDVVQVQAAMDNTEEAEDLPLAPWY